MNRNSSIQQQSLVNWLLLAAFWGILFLQLSFEWQNNKQYEYGIFVPLLGAYLVYLRWLDRPEITGSRLPSGMVWMLIGGIIACMYPLMIVFETNVDWRMVIWIQMTLVLGATSLLLWAWGGLGYVMHLSPAFLFYWMGVPWPTWVELGVIDNLLYFVTRATVDILNILGVVAIQSGNLIKLATGLLSMEEACSGVRSLQSSIMLGFYLGELFRFTVLQRVWMLIVGMISALAFNIVRTTTLSYWAAQTSPAAMNEWHDIAGYSVLFACCLSLIIWAWLIRSLNPVRAEHEPIQEEPRYLDVRMCIVGLIALMGTFPAVYYWYDTTEPLPAEGITWRIDWSKISPQMHVESANDTLREVLVFDTGDCARWMSDQGYYCLAYYFNWKRPKAAQLGGFHGPELCLPTAGWGLPETGEKLTWSQAGIELIFKSFRFEKQGQYVYVFFAQWDWALYPYHEKTGRMRLDRLKEAWNHKRSANKTNLQVAFLGPKSFEDAQSLLKEILGQSLVVEHR